jgi:hypothetical protein
MCWSRCCCLAGVSVVAEGAASAFGWPAGITSGSAIGAPGLPCAEGWGDATDGNWAGASGGGRAVGV